MKPVVGYLMPPNTPPGLPHGLQRGGVFEAPYVMRTYIDASRPTVPTDSPVSPDVPVDVFARPIAFSRPDVARPITGGGAVSGFGQFVQGMGPQRGAFMESPDPPPMVIGRAHPVATPHGHTEGSIFGPGSVPSMATGPSVPPVRTTDIMRARRLTQPIVLAGYGAGPDGLG